MQEGETAPTQTALTLDAVSRNRHYLRRQQQRWLLQRLCPSRLISCSGRSDCEDACVLNKLNKGHHWSPPPYWNTGITAPLHWIPPLTKGNTMYYSGKDYMNHIYDSRADSSKLWKPLPSILSLCSGKRKSAMLRRKLWKTVCWAMY